MKLKGFREALKEGLTLRFGEKAKSLVGLGLNLRPRREGEEDGGAMVNCMVAIFSEDVPVPVGAGTMSHFGGNG